MRGLRSSPSGPKPTVEMGVDVFDIVAIILGVLFTIRKLDAQRRTNKEFSHVEAGAFAQWHSQEISTFGTAMISCFAKVFADWVFVFFFADGLPFRTVQAIGATIDLSWFAVMMLTLYRTRRLTRLRSALRIVLGGFIVESNNELKSELSAALRTMEEGDLERAEYQVRQVILDADDSHKAIALYWLGECYLRQGKKDEARDAFVESLEEDPSLLQPQEAMERLDKSS